MNQHPNPGQLRPWSFEWDEAQEGHMGEAGCCQVEFYVIPDHLRLSVVIPIYNEEVTLRNGSYVYQNDRRGSKPPDWMCRDRSRDVIRPKKPTGLRGFRATSGT